MFVLREQTQHTVFETLAVGLRYHVLETYYLSGGRSIKPT